MAATPCATEVLAFWFGAPDDPGYARPRAEWFRKDPAFDASIAQRFGALVDQALDGGLTDWLVSPLQAPQAQKALAALARVIVLDQFPRNLFRGHARAFAGDAAALATARAIVAAQADRGLTGVQRQFVYLPFEHAEDIAMQREALRLFAQLEHDEPALAGLLHWAQRHHDIVARFGRFPHRNEILGRTPTPDETEFLRDWEAKRKPAGADDLPPVKKG